MTSPHNSTLDSHTCAPAQDLQAQNLLEALLDQDSRRAEILARPPRDTDDLFLVGCGEMFLGKNGLPAQDPETYHLMMTDLEGVVEIFRRGRTIGEKHDQPCVTMGWPIAPGSSKMANCGGVMWGILDIDEDMDDAKVAKLKRFLAPWGHYIFTSASHDPLGVAGAAKYRVKVMFLFDRNLTYKESALVMQELAIEVADYIGIDLVAHPKAIDPCCMRAMQPQLIPAHRSQEVMDQSWDHYQPGPSMRMAERLTRARAKIKEADEHAARERAESDRRRQVALSRAAAQGHAVAMTNPGFVSTGSMDWSTVAQGHGIDREKGAFDEIAALGIHPGSGISNDGLFRAAWICREWSLDSVEARRVFDQAFAGVYDPRRLDEKVRSCYGKGANASDGRAIERIVGARETPLEEMFSFDCFGGKDS